MASRVAGQPEPRYGDDAGDDVDAARGGDNVKAAYQEVMEKLLVLLQTDIAGAQARERALAVVALCVGGLAAARGVGDPVLAHELRRAAYRQAQTMLKARPC